ncbi:hypothetical protein P168DRAFT_286326 [Aspergillus campestris IBT 28561]|uniref:Serine-rich protein n=1 Tax=Aspergillus campestris (strain IBT 28561) TaxID=1392248 RepID=A0A2I1DE99_ASPC2|nr:uncharacterized protein P168DRAFT_286326 [Aspergillus campestris IBT 28561]PKY08176.1 hypothetical protein P168DRAFT_286326 [Aspergillus campestris IBT 28561]
MSSITRFFPLRATKSVFTPLTKPALVAPLNSKRTYSHGSYGSAESDKDKPQNTPSTKNIEHPGPPPPNTKSNNQPSESGESQGDVQDTSNKANPIITGGKQSPVVNGEGKVNDDAPDDVKKHNEDVANRADSPYNQIGADSKVREGFAAKGSTDKET